MNTHTQNVMLFTSEKEGNPAIFDNLDKHKGHYVKICAFILIFILLLSLNMHYIYIYIYNCNSSLYCFILEENCALIIFIIFQLNIIADSVIKHSLMKSL